MPQCAKIDLSFRSPYQEEERTTEELIRMHMVHFSNKESLDDGRNINSISERGMV